MLGGQNDEHLSQIMKSKLHVDLQKPEKYEIACDFLWLSLFQARVQKSKALVLKFMFTQQTRMHSSGMRTARLLTVSQHALRRGCLPEGVSAQGVSAWGGCIPACNGSVKIEIVPALRRKQPQKPIFSPIV